MVPAEMDFLHPFDGKLVQIVLRTGAEIGGRDEHVVDVEQQSASGPPRHFGKEFNLRDGAFGYTDISGRIFEQHLATQRRLYGVDMLRHARQRLWRVGQRQQIVEIDAVMR
jgi:hypothetical protein